MSYGETDQHPGLKCSDIVSSSPGLKENLKAVSNLLCFCSQSWKNIANLSHNNEFMIRYLKKSGASGLLKVLKSSKFVQIF